MPSLEETRLDTAQCIWEYVIEERHRYVAGVRTPFNENLERLFDWHGVATVRQIFRDSRLLDACNAGWELLTLTFGLSSREQLFPSYDWDYVPAFLEVCTNGSGLLKDGWHSALTADFALRLQKADEKPAQ